MTKKEMLGQMEELRSTCVDICTNLWNNPESGGNEQKNREKAADVRRKNPRYRNDLSHIACSGVCILLSVPVADPCIVFQIGNDLFV